MIKRYVHLMLALLSCGIFLSATPANQNNNNNPSSNRFPQNMRPGISNETAQPQRQRFATGREEIAYMDERDADIHERANRKGDWDYKQNWRYDRKAFYRGETQGEAYDREHPDGSGGPGLDRDTEFLEMRQYYLENAGQGRESQPQQGSYQSGHSASGYWQ
jgi:hypothetical protein